jgi:hypothetical protein
MVESCLATGSDDRSVSWPPEEAKRRAAAAITTSPATAVSSTSERSTVTGEVPRVIAMSKMESTMSTAAASISPRTATTTWPLVALAATPKSVSGAEPAAGRSPAEGYLRGSAWDTRSPPPDYHG